ncbi:MAG: hypothetical protein K2I90_07345 [Odoribacter sp.]|nr:hypothetical protein [Odoribacter sp.]
MAAKQDAVINELKSKIDKLINLYISSLERNKSLEGELQGLQSELEQVKGENKTLNEKIKTTKVASAISGGNGSYEAKVRINQLVREIDKCIALLNN